jgi:hypothetical protein
MYWNEGEESIVHSAWPEAEDIEPGLYNVLFSTANSLCVAYAPAIPEGAQISDSYKLAEIFQARDLYGQMMSGNREEYGADGLPIPVTRLNYLARDLLRPKSSPLKRLR